MNGDFKELLEILKKSTFEEEEDFTANIEAFFLKEELGIDAPISKTEKSTGAKIRLEYNFEKDGSKVPFTLDLVKKYIAEIEKYKPNTNFDFTICYVMDQKFIVDTKNCKTLEQVDNYLRETKDKELMISHNKDEFHIYGFRKTLNANRKLDSVADKIRNAKNNGEPLSPFEKFMVAYEYVTNFAYNEGGDVLHHETSHWIPVLEGDKIVCAGYASLLETLCNRIFTQNEVKVFNQGLRVFHKNENISLVGHGNNTVFIKDDKYNIDGLFYADPCWDSINANRKDKPQAYCCIPLRDVLKERNYGFVFEDNFSNLYLSKYKEYTEAKKAAEDSVDMGDFDFEEDIEVKKDFSDIVESFFMGYKKNGNEQEYFKSNLGRIVTYDRDERLSLEEKQFLERYKEMKEKEVSGKYGKLLEKYKHLEVPGYISNELIKYGHLDEIFNVIENDESKEEDVVRAIDAMAKVFSDERVKNYIERCKENNLGASTFDEFVSYRMTFSSCSKKEKETLAKKKQFIENAKKQNAIVTRTVLDEKAESNVVPIEAFINSYKIIGNQQGLRGAQLEEYVRNRIQKSIERTRQSFDIEKCSSCFAKQSVMKRG